MTEVESGSPRAAGPDRDIRSRHELVWLLAGSAALGAVLSGAAPTPSPVADAVINATVAVGVVYLSSRAGRWAWLTMAGVAMIAADSSVALLAAGSALTLGVVAVALDRRNRVVGAAVGALAVQALFRLPGGDRLGTATLIAVVAVVPVVVSGYRNAGRGVRRGLLIGAATVGVLAVGVALLTGIVALGQRSTVQAGIDQTRAGLRAAENGETTKARRLLSDAERSFSTASDAFGVPWLRPASAVPVLGQNFEALKVAADQGAALTATAGDVLIDADVESLRFQDGALDLELVRSFGPPLEDASAALGRAVDDLEAASSPWLLSPVGDRYEDFSAELADADADTEVAVEGVEVAPALFGGEGERRYLVLFTTPAEMRGLGGFVGNWAELTAVDGDLELTRSGRSEELRPAPGSPPHAISGPADYLDRWGSYQPGFHVQDTTFSPDFPSVAEVWQQIYPQTRVGAPIDGVILVDPYALAALMTFTGPISVPGYPTPLTAENAADILLREQYLTFEGSNEGRIDFLDDATRLTFEALTAGDLPGPREVTEVLGPVVREGRLLVNSVHPDEQTFFTGVDLDGALPPVEGDFLSVTNQNSGNNKIDIFLHRNIRYEVVYDPDTGRVEGEVTVTLRNDAPASGLPSYVIGNRDPSRIPIGANLSYLSVYTPWDVVDAALDGEPIPVEHAEELDRFVYGTFVRVPPGGTRTVTMTLEGAGRPGYDYRLTFAPQPLVNPDRLALDVRGAEGWEVCGTTGMDQEDARAVLAVAPLEDDTYGAEFCSV